MRVLKRQSAQCQGEAGAAPGHGCEGTAFISKSNLQLFWLNCVPQILVLKSQPWAGRVWTEGTGACPLPVLCPERQDDRRGPSALGAATDGRHPMETASPCVAWSSPVTSDPNRNKVCLPESPWQRGRE